MHNLSRLGYKLVSEPMLSAVMGKDAPALLAETYSQLDDFDLMLLEQELSAQGVPDSGPLGHISGNELHAELIVPELLGDSIQEHFEAMASEFLEPVLPLLEILLKAQEPVIPDPCIMLEAIAEYGAGKWLTFGLLGDFEQASTDLPAPAFVFDFETFAWHALGPHFAMPIIGTSISHGKTHLWVSQHLLDGAEHIPQTLDNLPSLGTGKLMVAHNIAYDACRYRERYNTEQQNYGLCTMAMHQQCAGLDANQRWFSAKSNKGYAPKWTTKGSLKSLVESYNFHCGPLGYEPLTKDDKAVRNIFVDCSLPEIKEQLPEALKYAMNDPLYTLRVFKAAWPKYKAITPSNVPLAAQMLLSHSLLQVDSEWHEWLAKCDAAAKAEQESISKSFAEISTKYVKQWREQLISLANTDQVVI